MINVNMTVFHFYLAMIDFFSDFLSQKYPDSSLDDTKHFETVIIAKIKRMFHSLELLSNGFDDEISARSILRTILDSVATYSFIYGRSDTKEKMFRHYLYALDGYRVYRDAVVLGVMENRNRQSFEHVCNSIINQIEEKLYNHVYSHKPNLVVSRIIKEADWKYVSLSNNDKYGFIDLYKMMGIEDITANYFQQFLSQFSHGLCLSNYYTSDAERLNRVLLESIIVADKMIKAVCNSFPYKIMLSSFLKSTSVSKLLNSPEFKIDELAEYVKSLMEKEDRILIR